MLIIVSKVLSFQYIVASKVPKWTVTIDLRRSPSFLSWSMVGEDGWVEDVLVSKCIGVHFVAHWIESGDSLKVISCILTGYTAFQILWSQNFFEVAQCGIRSRRSYRDAARTVIGHRSMDRPRLEHSYHRQSTEDQNHDGLTDTPAWTLTLQIDTSVPWGQFIWIDIKIIDLYGTLEHSLWRPRLQKSTRAAIGSIPCCSKYKQEN